jgi:hypothetical protein
VPPVGGAAPHSCRTCRQAETLDQIGYALGGEAGARLAARLAVRAAGGFDYQPRSMIVGDHRHGNGT